VYTKYIIETIAFVMLGKISGVISLLGSYVNKFPCVSLCCMKIISLEYIMHVTERGQDLDVKLST
jgi:hypothetical protein